MTLPGVPTTPRAAGSTPARLSRRRDRRGGDPVAPHHPVGDPVAPLHAVGDPVAPLHAVDDPVAPVGALDVPIDALDDPLDGADEIERRRLVADLDRELADLETRRYTDPRGIGGRAETVVRTARRHGLTTQKYRGRLIIADQASRSADVAGAIETARTILLQARGRDEFTVMARSEAVIAWCLFRLGAIGDAATHAVESVRLLPPDAPAHLGVDHRMILALLNAMQSHDESYVAVFEEVLADADRLGNPRLLLSVLNNYAWSHTQHGRAAAARPLVDRLRSVAATADIALNSTILDTIATVLLETGQLAEAEAVALAMMHPEVPDAEVRATPEAMLTLAKIRHRRGAPAAALDLVRSAETIAADRGLPEITAAVTMEKSRLLAEAGDHRGAYEALLVSHDTWVRVRDRESEARASSMHALFETEQARRRSVLFEELADRDPLTGLWNRRHLDRLLPGMLTDHQVAGVPLSIAIIDVDHFKQVNDERSHLTGDAALARIGEVLAPLVEEPGFAARLGGEEFVLVLPGADASGAYVVCEQTRVRVASQLWDTITDGLPITVSVGYATSAPSATVSWILNAADDQLYRAKHAGRNRVYPVPGEPGDPDVAATRRKADTQR